MKRLKEFIVVTDLGKLGTQCSGRPGIDFILTNEAIGSLVCLLAALQGAKIGYYKFPVPNCFPTKRKHFGTVSDADAILSVGSCLVDDIEQWCGEQILNAE